MSEAGSTGQQCGRRFVGPGRPLRTASTTRESTGDLDEASERPRSFEAAYRGKIDVAGRTVADLLLAAVSELEKPFRADGPARPSTPACSTPPRPTTRAHGALLARTRERRTAINKHLIFFDLEWVKVADDAAACARRRHPDLARYRHYLEQKRAWRPHYLSEPEEKMLDEKAVTGRAAFVRLFDETVAIAPFPVRARRRSRDAEHCSRSSPSSTTPTATVRAGGRRRA